MHLYGIVHAQCLSHFAAPFISVQAKTFITEGCKLMDERDESHKVVERSLKKGEGAESLNLTAELNRKDKAPKHQARGLKGNQS